MSQPKDSAAEHRAKQTVNNLVLALLASLGILLIIVLIVPRDDSMRIERIDYQSEAINASASIGELAFAPEISENWWSNGAQLETSGGVTSWYVGFVTDKNQFIGITQGFGVNPTWLALELQGNWQAGEISLGGLDWEIWEDLTPSEPKESKHYALVHSYGENSVLVYGTAESELIQQLASQLGPQLSQDQ